MKKVLLYSLLLMSGFYAQAQESLTLEQAKSLALQNNRLVGIQKEKVKESELKVLEAKTKNKPMFLASGTYLFNGIKKDLELPMGAFGQVDGTYLPQQNIPLFKGKHNLLLGSVAAYQPISQLGKIKVGVKAAEADVRIAETQVSKAELEVLQGVEKLYYGMLIAQKQLDEANANVQLTQAKLYDVESALLAGKTDEVYKVGLQAELANQQQKVVQIMNQMEDYSADLKNVLGVQDTTSFKLADVNVEPVSMQTLETYQQEAKNANPDVKLANQTIEKVNYGLEAAKKDKLPNIGVVGGYTYQNVVSDLPNNNYFLGLNLSWDIYDFGKRKSQENQRLSQKKQAQEYLAYTQEDVAAKIGKAYRKITQSQRLITVANQAVTLRREEVRMKTNAREAGLKLEKDLLESKVNLAKAEQDLYAAQLAYRLAIAEINTLTGTR